jgi:hypothetical protein
MNKIAKLLIGISLLVILVFCWLYLREESPKNHQFYTAELPEKFTKTDSYERYDLANKFVLYVDFSKSRNKRRLWVVDHGKVIATSYTSQGSGSVWTRSNFEVPKKFSNTFGSNQSSLGLFRINFIRKMNPPYEKHNCSCEEFVNNKKCAHWALKFPLNGLEETNNASLDRGILIHAARYVSENGCIGNSDGCFVVSPEVFELLQNKKWLPWEKWYLLAVN